MNGEVENAKQGAAVQAYPEHSCYLWNNTHYHIRPEYTAAVCGTCGAITGFKWRKPWRRFVSLLTDEPTAAQGSEIRAAKLVVRTRGWP